MEEVYKMVMVGILACLMVLPSSYGQDTNIALEKLASQLMAFNDTASGFLWSANKSVDGRFNETQYCSASLLDMGSNDTNFWQVDLGAEFMIGRIVVYGRPDANAETQLSGFTLHIIRSDTTTQQLVYTDNVTVPYPVDSRFEILVDPAVMGQHVRVERAADPSVIALCEVEVYEADVTTDSPTSGPTDDPSMSPGTGNTTLPPGVTTTTTMAPTMSPTMGVSTTERSNGAQKKILSVTTIVLSALVAYLWH